MQIPARGARVIVFPEANSGFPLKGDFERMAKRRFQDPKPFREGNWWWINPRQDIVTKGGLTRKRKRMKVAPADVSAREAQKIAAEMLRPMNQGLKLIGSATQFRTYVEDVYRRTAFPLLSSTTRAVYSWILDKYLVPVFGDAMLRDLTTMTLQEYFSGLGKNHATAMKVKDALARVLSGAVKYGLLAKNPRLPACRFLARESAQNHTSPPSSSTPS